MVLTTEEISKLCKEIEKVAVEYEADRERITKETEKNLVRREYTRGGEGLFRGYYCPSLVMDVIVGNVTRGKLLKKLTQKQPTYEFGFDAHDTLLYSKSAWGIKEYIFRNQQAEIGVVYDDVLKSVRYIAKCIFENDRKLCYHLFTLLRGKVIAAVIEQYNYTEEGISSVDYYNYYEEAGTGFGRFSSRTEYKFHRDDDRIISKVYVKDYLIDQPNKPKTNRPFDNCYSPKNKRKI